MTPEQHSVCHHHQNNPRERATAQWGSVTDKKTTLFCLNLFPISSVWKCSAEFHLHICSFTFCERCSVSYSGPHKPFCNIQHEYQLRFHRVCIPAAGRPLWLYNVLVVVFVIKNWMLWDHTDDEIKVFISLTYISADVEVPHVTVPLRCAYIKSVLINVHADSGERVCCVLTCFV